MIKSFKHKGLERFYKTSSTAGIQAMHASRLRLQLFALSKAKKPSDMSAPGWDLHPMKGKEKGVWSVSVSGNWRMTFCFDDDGDAVLVDYRDYH
ncbi:type II toxin-antitoxin system RelE/ParE family toxin [Serratia fonticola]|uniref:type II toxin-antitoxin system RelE/ParE family toxin n=1 Tax=Serratia fonticola TaxID=47917 RepID=UPI001648A67A|nr:type II toxin-antitoxin system RelE/ParE family toxin [Serratia fonticola]MBC3250990.1 type II toxin-antitoxin system RelE/ParE family toxin [Serratia fonticola]